jgi:hypothetical protein
MISSLMLFLGVTAFQHKINSNFIVSANLLCGMYPSLAFVGREFMVCDKRSGADFHRVMNAVQVIPTLLLPLMIFYISANNKFHDGICSMLHGIEFKSKSLPAAAKVATNASYQPVTMDIAERARAAVARANRALGTSMTH